MPMRPRDIPGWSETVPANIVKPAQSKINTGNLPNEQPAAGFENWLKNLLSGYAKTTGDTWTQLVGKQMSVDLVTTRDCTAILERLDPGNVYGVPAGIPFSAWGVLDTAGNIWLAYDPYAKVTSQSWQDVSLPGAATPYRAGIVNPGTGTWIVVGDNENGTFSDGPQIARSVGGFPVLVGDWDAVLTAAGTFANLNGVAGTSATDTLVATGNIADAGRFLRSTDDGVNWTAPAAVGAMLTVAAVYTPQNNHATTPNPKHGEFVIVGTEDDGGALDTFAAAISTDDGATWTDATVSGATSFGPVGADIIMDVTHNGEVWLATCDQVDEVYTSVDGLSWGTIAVGALTSDESAGFPALSCAADEMNGMMFIGAGGSQLSISADNGTTWQRASDVAPPIDVIETLTRTAINDVFVSPTGQLGLGTTADTNGLGTLNGLIGYFSPKLSIRDAEYNEV